MVRLMENERFQKQNDLEIDYYNRHKKRDLKPAKQPSDSNEDIVPEFNQLYDDNGMSYLVCFDCRK
jgi:hypothetical protein